MTTADEFKIGDRVQAKQDGVLTKKKNQPLYITGLVIDVSTSHNFLKVRSDATGLEQWHQAEWCKKI